MHAGEEIVNRLIWKLLSSSLSGEEELLNRLFSSKWELLPIQLNLKRNNEGIISLVVLSYIDALVELEETNWSRTISIDQSNVISIFIFGKWKL